MYLLAKAALVLTVHALALGPAATYTVHPHDTLSGIAASHCGGKTNDWTGIYQHNKRIIGSNPNLIYAGEKLKITCTDPPRLLSLAADGDGDHDGDQSDATAPAPAPPAPRGTYYGAPGSFRACVIQRESGGNPGAVNPYSGAGGLYGFLPSTWAALGLPGLPENAPIWMQNEAFAKEYALAGTSPWAAYDGC